MLLIRCLLTTGIVMGHSSWLSSGLPREVQATVEDLPFEGKTLFSTKIDESLYALKDLSSMLSSLCLYTQVFKKTTVSPPLIIL